MRLTGNKVKIYYQSFYHSMTDKNSEIVIARTAATGAFHIFVGKIISRIIGIATGIILIRLFADPAKYGLLNIAIVFPGILLIFGDLGIEDAVIKYVSESAATGNKQNIKIFFYTGLLLKIVPNVILAVIGFFTAEFFANFLDKTYAAPYIQIASLLVLAWAMYSIAVDSLLAVDATKIYGLILILNETLLGVMPIVLVFYGLEVMGALIGMIVASLLTSTTAVIASILKINAVYKQNNNSKEADATSISFKSVIRTILMFGAPLMIIHFINTGLGKYYSFMIAKYCLPEVLGNYSIAQRAINVIDYVAWPISLVIFPMFSKIPNHKNETLDKLFTYSVKYSSLIILPITLLLMIFAFPLVILVFGKEYEASWIYVSLLALTGLFYGLGGAHMRKVLLSRGETRFLAYMGTVSAITAIAISLILIPLYGVFGLIATAFISGWPSYIAEFKMVSQKYGLRPPFKTMGKIYLSLAVMGAVSFASLMLIKNEIACLTLGPIAGLAAYLICATLIGAIKKTDVNNLKEMFKEPPLLGKIISVPLNFLERFAR